MRIEILKFLSDSYDFKPLNEFLKNNFSSASYQQIATVLWDMARADEYNLIHIRDDEYKLLSKNFYYYNLSHLSYYKGPANQYVKTESTPSDPKEEIGTLDNLTIEARITEKGRKELEQYELRESIRSVNHSVISTSRITLTIAALAAFFSLLSIIVPLLKSDKLSIPQLQETNRQLQKQGQALDSMLHAQMRVLKDSSKLK